MWRHEVMSYSSKHLNVFDYKSLRCIKRFYLPRDAIVTRPIPSCGVRPSACLSRSCIVSKRVNMSLTFYRLVDVLF